jgi:LysM repeat protein
VYTVQEGDYLALLVEKFSLGEDGVALILLLNPYTVEATDNSIDPATQNIYPGQKITMPNPGMPLPTPTPIPANLPSGTKVPYYVQAGDTLQVIASKFNSTIEAIIAENKIVDANAIQVGQKLIIPINLVTATATRPPTSTSGPTSSVAFPSVTPKP